MPMIKRIRGIFTLLGLAVILAALAARAEVDSAQFFKQNCASCHSIGGGRLVGPDLKDVTKRQDREWLVKFILDPPAVFASGDEYAAKILREANNVPMPKIPGVDAVVAGKLLDYIDIQSGVAPAATAAPAILTPEDVAAGRRIYLGIQPLKRGGPACITCHQVAGLQPPGGGLLGPDLTHVSARLGGVKGLSAWLSAPAAPTMQPIYRDKALDPEEITALVAYFQQLAGEHGSTAQAATIANTITFLLLGILTTVVILGFLDWVWRKRFTAVRDSLVKKGEKR